MEECYINLVSYKECKIRLSVDIEDGGRRQNIMIKTDYKFLFKKDEVLKLIPVGWGTDLEQSKRVDVSMDNENT